MLKLGLLVLPPYGNMWSTVSGSTHGSEDVKPHWTPEHSAAAENWVSMRKYCTLRKQWVQIETPSGQCRTENGPEEGHLYKRHRLSIIFLGNTTTPVQSLVLMKHTYWFIWYNSYQLSVALLPWYHPSKIAPVDFTDRHAHQTSACRDHLPLKIDNCYLFFGQDWRCPVSTFYMESNCTLFKLATSQVCHLNIRLPSASSFFLAGLTSGQSCCDLVQISCKGKQEMCAQER